MSKYHEKEEMLKECVELNEIYHRNVVNILNLEKDNLEIKKRMYTITNKIRLSPKVLNEKEKIIYYFHKVEKVNLSTIAKCFGVSRDHIAKISSKINKKLKKSSLKL